jgi:rhamnosyltransferase
MIRSEDTWQGEAFKGLAGVLIAYYPDTRVEENIFSYLETLNFLLIVDNSPTESATLKSLQKTGKVCYQWDGTNYGIAEALNRGAMKGVQLGFKWLLTMDQDSRFTTGALQLMVAFANTQCKVGIISPMHNLTGGKKGNSTSRSEVIKVAMTSGNLLNLEAYQACGPFMNKLFIDYVDYEYCLRLSVE